MCALVGKRYQPVHNEKCLLKHARVWCHAVQDGFVYTPIHEMHHVPLTKLYLLVNSIRFQGWLAYKRFQGVTAHKATRYLPLVIG